MYNSIKKKIICRIVVKRSMVLALFYVVAIQTVPFSVTCKGISVWGRCN